MIIAASCGGSKNNVNSGGLVSGSNGVNTTTPLPLVNFEGVYDIMRMDSADCGASVRITRECAGYKLSSNHSRMDEDFCNLNRNADSRSDRNAVIVTQEGNVLRSIVKIGPNQEFINMLTLQDNGVLVKASNFKGRTSRCIYQKR